LLNQRVISLARGINSFRAAESERSPERNPFPPRKVGRLLGRPFFFPLSLCFLPLYLPFIFPFARRRAGTNARAIAETPPRNAINMRIIVGDGVPGALLS